MTDTAPADAMREVIEQVMSIEDVTLGGPQATVQARGTLTKSADEAFDTLQAGFGEHAHMPLLYHQAGQDHVLAVDSEVMAPTRPLRWLSIALFVVMFVRLAKLGVQQDAQAPLESLLDYFRNWTAALPFLSAMLGIVVARELARFLVARRYDLPVSWPLFIPVLNLSAPLLLPFAFLGGEAGVALFVGIVRRFLMPWGTLGAIVGLRTPARNRRVVFDMAVAATLAGFLVSLIVLVVGLLQSEVMEINFTQSFFLEGQSLGYRLIKLALFGKWLPGGGEDVFISTLALAGWAGLFVTSLHLLPFGSLDGGHILYGLIGPRSVWVRRAVAVVLLALSIFHLGWLLWLLIIFLLLRDDAQVLDEITPLGTGRIVVGIGMLLLLALLFTPVPFQFIDALVPFPDV
jgi:membrane-associated protease RseP (regulator of RpoE activity)